jgi:6-phospho-beta-glucosidase
LEFYDRLINYLLEKGIQPFVTLYHFECPMAPVEEFGGWASRRMIDLYLKYAEICFKHFKGRIKMWATVNEQLIATSSGRLNGNAEKDPKQYAKVLYQMSYHVSLAEHKAISLLREIDPEATIGPVCAIQVIYPRTCKPEDVLAAEYAEEMMQYYLLDMSVYGKYPPYFESYLKKNGLYPYTEEEDVICLQGSKPDFIGINYYFSGCVEARDDGPEYGIFPPWAIGDYKMCENPHVLKTEWMTNGIDPKGLMIGLRKAFHRYRLPMIICENGMAYSETLDENFKIHDTYRIDYLTQHILQVKEAIDEGYPVFGYCPWSFIDVVSSHQGFSKRYGLIYIDRTEKDVKECKRYKKDSFYWYQSVIKNNGI